MKVQPDGIGKAGGHTYGGRLITDAANLHPHRGFNVQRGGNSLCGYGPAQDLAGLDPPPRRAGSFGRRDSVAAHGFGLNLQPNLVDEFPKPVNLCQQARNILARCGQKLPVGSPGHLCFSVRITVPRTGYANNTMVGGFDQTISPVNPGTVHAFAKAGANRRKLLIIKGFRHGPTGSREPESLRTEIEVMSTYSKKTSYFREIERGNPELILRFFKTSLIRVIYLRSFGSQRPNEVNKEAQHAAKQQTGRVGPFLS